MREEKGRILVVDDEESIRRNLRSYLEDEGLRVSDAESGEEALDLLTNNPFEAAIVDMRLPGMDGNAFIEHAHELDSQLGFLIFTGSAGYQLPEQLTKMGMQRVTGLYETAERYEEAGGCPEGALADLGRA